MESILFEKQEASLCAQHALNMLLQGPYFSAVDLAEIARRLDVQEHYVLPTDRPESGNMDDSGFFSVQVIAKALGIFNLELVPLTSPRAAEYRADPTSGCAYICNLNEHWFAIRRLGFQWFKLNSLLASPKLISNTYLNLYLAQLANDGYSIFAVEGDLPPCTADEIIMQCPVDPALAAQSEPIREDQREDEDLARAIALSLAEENKSGGVDIQAAINESKRLDESDDPSLQQALRKSAEEAMTMEDEETDPQLQKALQMSLETNMPSTSKSVEKETLDIVAPSGEPPECSVSEGSSADAADVRLKREKFLSRFDK